MRQSINTTHTVFLQTRIINTNIPRALQVVSFNASTYTTGVPCTLQQITVHGATSGTYQLTYGPYASAAIPYSASADQMRALLLAPSALGNAVSDLLVKRYQDTDTTVRYEIYFISTPGNHPNLPLTQPQLSTTSTLTQP